MILALDLAFHFTPDVSLGLTASRGAGPVMGTATAILSWVLDASQNAAGRGSATRPAEDERLDPAVFPLD